MGCSISKLDDEEAVRLCKDRKRFIKQAVEQRVQFASGHIAYIQSLQRISAALHDYIEGDDEILLDPFTKPPFRPSIKNTNEGGCISAIPIQSEHNPSLKINYLRSSRNPAIVVQERPPQSPETIRIESHPPMPHYGDDGFFGMQSSPINSSSYISIQNTRSNFLPPSPQTSPWDFFWDPFTSLDNYGYPGRSDLDQIIIDDDINRLRQLREEEGIPDLEEDETEHKVDVNAGKPNMEFNWSKEEVTIEDDDDDDEGYVTDSGSENLHEVKELKPHDSSQRMEVSEGKTREVEIVNEKKVVGDQDSNEEMPGFTVYEKRRPTSMREVIKDLELQFTTICNSANEVSHILETSKAQYSWTPNEISATKMLNPLALIRSASSRSSSSRFLTSFSNSKDEIYENSSTSDFVEELSIASDSHQSSLGKLYEWEKKLYEEVKCGERFRIAYEKKRIQLLNQDAKGEDPTIVDKTRVAMRDLHTHMTVSLQKIEVISKRIEALRNEELQPQLIELIHRLGRIWRVMAECHSSQKQTLDNAKHHLLTHKNHPNKLIPPITDPAHLSLLAAKLECHINTWRSCFELWIHSQRSYARALTAWLMCCLRLPDSQTSRHPSVDLAPSLFGVCMRWSSLLDGIQDTAVRRALDFFASGVGSLHGTKGEEGFGEEKGEVFVRVLCAGLLAAIGSLDEYASACANAYMDLLKQTL